MIAKQSNNFAEIRVSPPIAKMYISLDNWQYKTIPSITERQYNKILNDGVRIMKQEAPRRSGDLRRSIRIKTKTTSGGKRDKRYHARIGANVRYAQFVERGTSPSPGRFIPAIEKRIRTGMHPGTPANPYVMRTTKRLNEVADRYAKKIFHDAKSRFRL